MQFTIHLEKSGKGYFLPISYQPKLSSAISRILEQADTGYSHLIHKGQKGLYKPFTFSMLNFDTYRIHQPRKRIEHYGPHARMNIRFAIDPMAEEFIKNLFMNQKIQLGEKEGQAEYQIIHIEASPPVCFQEEMQYRCMSPVFLRSQREDGGTNFLFPKDNSYAQVLKENLIGKLMSCEPENRGLKNLDAYCPEMRFELLSRPRKKRIIFRNHNDTLTNGVGYLFDFSFTAPVFLQEPGYYGGFGNKNAQGFGCVLVKKP